MMKARASPLIHQVTMMVKTRVFIILIDHRDVHVNPTTTATQQESIAFIAGWSFFQNLRCCLVFNCLIVS